MKFILSFQPGSNYIYNFICSGIIMITIIIKEEEEEEE
jgi:hypothetical protein